jgi:hypothetical protein
MAEVAGTSLSSNRYIADGLPENGADGAVRIGKIS